MRLDFLCLSLTINTTNKIVAIKNTPTHQKSEMMTVSRLSIPKNVRMLGKRTWREDFKRNKALYLFVLPAVIEVFIFNYMPMYGAQIAFRNFKPARGIWGSAWAGLKWFERFFNSFQSGTVIANTLLLNILLLVCSMPVSIAFALLVNQYRSARAKKIIQTVSYAPHFISTVVMCGMITLFLSPSQGLYGTICRALGLTLGNPMGEAGLFRPIYIFTDVWQHMGWESIIYIATLSTVDPGLYDAATVDGASKVQRIWYIELPSLVPTITLLFIMRVGSLMSLGFEKAYLLQNNLNLATSEILSTYVYKVGLVQNAQYSYSAAIGLLNSMVNMCLLFTFNQLSRRIGETSLW